MAPDALVTIEEFFERLHPEDREPARQAIEASIHQRIPYDMIYRTVNPRSGEQKWIRALGGVVYGSDGAARQFDGVTVDVTAQKQDQQRLAELNEQLTEQDRRKDEFLATLAHELRNPLAPVRSGLEALQRGGTAEQMARTRGMMERQLGHLVRMVDDLLDVSRITLGKSTLKKQSVDFHAVADSALETTRPLLAGSGHNLEVSIDPRPLPLFADATRLTQVLANLISNAVRYTPAGGQIRLSADIQADHLIVTVSDTGIGIPAEMLPRVFDLFAQVYPAMDSSQGGLGIGLTLAKRLTEMHGGSIQAQSAGPGAGSRFTVSLPLAMQPPPAAVPAPATHGGTSEALRILVVDDNVDAAESLAFLLGLEGHATRVVHSGLAAVAAAEEFQPHVGLLDIGLPDINGHEVARRLRASTRMSDQLVLIALTGWGSEQDRRQAEAAGFDHHLVKPVELAHLLEAVGNCKRGLDTSKPTDTACKSS
jgi:signal transduction histidine kinase/CheY-like chemotaxis protein